MCEKNWKIEEVYYIEKLDEKMIVEEKLKKA